MFSLKCFLNLIDLDTVLHIVSFHKSVQFDFQLVGSLLGLFFLGGWGRDNIMVS